MSRRRLNETYTISSCEPTGLAVACNLQLNEIGPRPQSIWIELPMKVSIMRKKLTLSNGCLPTRPSLLKRKRTVSEDEEPSSEISATSEIEEQIVQIQRRSCMEELPPVSSPGQSESDVPSSELGAENADTAYNNNATWSHISSRLSRPFPLCNCITIPIHLPEPYLSWKYTLRFRALTCLLTPQQERLSPLPVLSWADPHEVWDLMCIKDEISARERDEHMFTKHPCLQPRMRAILLDWLIEVCEVYKLHRETYHLSMDFIDRYLSSTRNVPKQQLQLVGITCLFIAAKVEEIYPPKIKEFAYVTDEACTEPEILDMELVILKSLNWNLSPVTVNSWLNIYMQLCCDGRKRARQAERQGQPDPSFVFPQYSGLTFVQTAQLVDLCMLDEGCLRFPYSVLAASALYHMSNRELALLVSGLQWNDISDCVRWMSAFASTVKNESTTQVMAAVRQGTASSSDGPSGSGLLKSMPHIVVDDSHNIQTHIVDLTMLEKAQMKLIQTSVEESPVSSKSAVPNLLTPPMSNRKMSDHKVTITGGLT